MSTDNEQHFMLLWKGHQSGPFAMALIREKLSSGEISRMHQISFNGRWITLGEFLDKQSGPSPEDRLREEAKKREKQLRHEFEAQLASERARKSIVEQQLLEAEKRSRSSQPPPLPIPPPPPPQYHPQPEEQYQTSPPQVVVKPDSYMASAILVTLFCCLPFGIVSIVYASQVDSKFNAGDYAGAQQASNSAKTWYHAALITGFLAIILYVVGAAIQHR